MKRILALTLALLLVFSLASCASQKTTSSPSASASASAAPSASAAASASASASTADAKPVASPAKGVTIPTFSITINNVKLDQTAMAALPMYSVQATSTNSAGTKTTITYVGFAMKDVLAAAGLKEKYVWLQASASDGYKVTIKGDTVLDPTTLLAVTRDGKPLGAGPWLAPCASPTTGDFLKDCASILVNTKDGAPDVSAAPAASASSKPSASASAAPSASASAAAPAASGALPEIQDKTSKVEFQPFSFLVNGKAVTNDTLKGVSIYKITVSVVNKTGEKSDATYTGYKLADVLKACGVASASSVSVKASDGKTGDVKADLIKSDYTLVAIEKDKATGEGGTVWIAPCSETANSSYLKLVTEIVAK